MLLGALCSLCRPVLGDRQPEVRSDPKPTPSVCRFSTRRVAAPCGVLAVRPWKNDTNDPKTGESLIFQLQVWGALIGESRPAGTPSPPFLGGVPRALPPPRGRAVRAHLAGLGCPPHLVAGKTRQGAAESRACQPLIAFPTLPMAEATSPACGERVCACGCAHTRVCAWAGPLFSLDPCLTIRGNCCLHQEQSNVEIFLAEGFK